MKPINRLRSVVNVYKQATAYLSLSGTTVLMRAEAIKERDASLALMPDALSEAVILIDILTAALLDVVHHADDEQGFMVMVREVLTEAGEL